MSIDNILERLREKRVIIEARDDRLRFFPREALTTAEIEELKLHKAELMVYLTRHEVVDARPVWHGDEVKGRVERDGLCVFWSDLFEEAVAFIADDGFRDEVPGGIVCYTVDELATLFGADGEPLSGAPLKLIHHAKKYGARIIDHQIMDDGDADDYE